jgi:hypothetical protein
VSEYVAIQMGFYDGARVRVGQKFEGPPGMWDPKRAKKLWFVPVEKYEPVKPKPAGGPVTYSELARAKAQAPIDLEKARAKGPQKSDLENV